MKRLICYACLAVLLAGGVFGLTSSANAQTTVADLQAQIQELLAQIKQLQAQIATQQGTITTWCHTFDTNLRIGDSGSEVVALRTALEQEGLSGLKGIAGTSEFNEQVASAVVGFQEKYKNEILTPLGLPRGTGFVGSASRAKLNALYGCGGITPIPPFPVPPPSYPFSITVLSPNGGEKWEIGKTYDVVWNYSGPKECTVSVVLTNVKGGMTYGGNNLPIPASLGRYSFTVSSNISTGSDIYKMEVIGGKGCSSDESDKYFSVVASTSTTQPSITILSPNGGETLTIGQDYFIRWQANGLEKVRIYIETPDSIGSGSTNYITEGISNTGSYNWVVLNNILPVSSTNRYKIRIDGFNTVGQPTASLTTDRSDNYFSIVASSTALNSSPVMQSMTVTLNASGTGELSASALDPDNDDLVWSVTWGDGTGELAPCVLVSNPPVPLKQSRQGWTFTRSHTWLRSGVYTVTATASDCRGGTAAYSISVNVPSE